VGPIYPYLCAAVFKVFGTFSNASAWVILTLNGLFSALTCVPIYAVGRRVFDRRVALCSAWAWAVVPYFMLWGSTWVWEASLSALLVALMFWKALTLRDFRVSRWKWAAGGVLCGIAALTNPALMTFAPFVLIWPTWRLRWARGARLALIGTVAFVATISPWLIRSRVVFGEWVFIRSNLGFEFHLGNWHGSSGMGWRGMHPAVNEREYELYKSMGELAYVRMHTNEAIAFVKEAPGEFAELCVIRFIAFWDGMSIVYSESWNAWQIGGFFAFSLLSACGLGLMLWRRVPAAVLFCWLLVYPVPYYLCYAHPRYRHAIEPMMLLLAVSAVSEGIGWIRTEELRRVAKARVRKRESAACVPVVPGA
jgi:4-amino-4-deoxy-L-arabinose transferase-like glycosyltransferase